MLTALAGVIKLFSIRQDMFYMVLIGQAIGSTGQVFVLPLPTKIAAVWFKPNEVRKHTLLLTIHSLIW